jgi:hypothetical protein
MLFQGLNETDFGCGDASVNIPLPEQGSSLMVNPFFDAKKKPNKR